MHEWFGALRSLPSIAPRLVFRKRTLEEELQEVRRRLSVLHRLCCRCSELWACRWRDATHLLPKAQPHEVLKRLHEMHGNACPLPSLHPPGDAARQPAQDVRRL